jgi:hypothetical protein
MLTPCILSILSEVILGVKAGDLCLWGAPKRSELRRWTWAVFVDCRFVASIGLILMSVTGRFGLALRLAARTRWRCCIGVSIAQIFYDFAGSSEITRATAIVRAVSSATAFNSRLLHLRAHEICCVVRASRARPVGSLRIRTQRPGALRDASGPLGRDHFIGRYAFLHPRLQSG